MLRRPYALLLLLAVACVSDPNEPGDLTEQIEDPNVTVHAGAEMVTTDTAVLIDGERRITLSNGPRGFGVYHFTEYTYGGFFEPINDDLVDEQWFMDIARRVVTDVRGDTVFSRSLDFGDITLEGTAARKHEIDTTIVSDMGDHVRVYENILMNRITIYLHRLNMDGSEVSFVEEPFYRRMIAGDPIELTASGSDEIGPTSALLTFDPGFRMASLWNGDYLNFEQNLPVFRTDQPLVVEMTRPLDHERTVLILSYVPPPPHDMDPDAQRRASAVFMLRETTSRVVIPASALAEIAANMPGPEGSYVFRFYEYRVLLDALEIERLQDGITENLWGFQSNGFGLYVRLRR